MIRVNLLPQKRAPRATASQPSQNWMLVLMGVLALEAVLLFLFHGQKEEELARQRAENKKLEDEIAAIQASMADREKLKKELARMRARDEAIAKLEKARTGPTNALLELAQLMTPGKGPSIESDVLAQMRRENPNAGYSPSWDTRRLWLKSYVETGRTVRLEGQARDGNDVYELAQRLKLSPYFHDVQLLQGKRDTPKEAQLGVADFALQLKVKY